MSSDLTCFINISPSDGFLFSNSCNNDMLIYTETPEQNILIGTHSNIPAILRISSNQTSVYGNIVPYSDGVFSLGTPSLRFKDLFLTGATLDIGGVQLKLDETSNSLAVKTSDGEYTRIIAQEIQLGSDSNSVVVKIDPSNSSIQFLNVANSNGVVFSNISSLSQWSNEGPALFTENVNLGINTSNPQYALDVNGDINFSGAFLENGIPYLEAHNIYASSSNLAIGISNSEPGFSLGYDASFKSNVTIFGVLTVSNIQYVTSNVTVLDTQIVNSNITTLNTLTFSNQTGTIILDSSNGNLGVGTSSPEHTLDVNGDINFTGTLKQNGKEYVGSQWSNIYNSVCILDSNVAIGTSNAETGFVSAVDSTFRSNVTFLDGLSLGASASIHHSESNVGINNSNPQYTLDINGDINFTGKLFENGVPFKSGGQLIVDDGDAGIISNSNMNVLLNTGSAPEADWAVSIEGVDASYGDGNFTSSVTDSLGNTYSLGYYIGDTPKVFLDNKNSDIALEATLESTQNNGIFLLKHNSDGNLIWKISLNIGGVFTNYRCLDIDNDGNVYILCQYYETFTIFNSDGNSSGITLLNTSNSGNGTSCLIKFDSQGVALWAVRLVEFLIYHASGFKIDKQSGIVYVAATSKGTLTNGSVYNSDNTITVIQSLDSHNMIAFSSNGIAQWYMYLTGSGVLISDLDIDSEQNIYLTGSYTGTPDVYDANYILVNTMSNSVSIANFLIKVNTNGNVEWVLNNHYTPTYPSISIDYSDNIYMVTNFINGFEVKNANNVQSGIIPQSSSGIISLKYDKNGIAQSVTTFDKYYAYSYALNGCDNFGNLYIAVQTTDALSIDINHQVVVSPSTSLNIYVIKYNNNGLAEWIVSVNGFDNYGYINDFSVDSNGNTYLYGAYLQPPDIYNQNLTQSGVTLTQSESVYSNSLGFLIKYSTTKITYKLLSDPTVYTDGACKYILNASDEQANVEIYNSNNTLKLSQFNIKPNETNALVWYDSNWHYVGVPGYSFSSNNIAFDAEQISLSASNTTLLMSNNGCVGINNSNPTYTLDVNGDINFTGDLFKEGVMFNTGRLIADATYNEIISNSNLSLLANIKKKDFKADWAVTIDSDAGGEPIEVAIDNLGNTYVIGSVNTFTNFVHFPDNTSNLFTTSSSYYFLKINSNGFQDWIIEFDGTGSLFHAAGIATDDLNNVYVTTSFVNSAIVLNANGGNSGISVNGVNGSYIVKYDPNGIAQWALTVDGTNVSTMSIDKHENLYLACIGNFGSPQTLIYNRDNTLSSFTIEGDQSQSSHIIKYDSNGFVQWTSSIDATDYVWGLNIDQALNIYYSGYFSYYSFNVLGLQPIIYNSDKTSNLSIQNTNELTYLVKLNSNGICQWAVSTSGQYGRNQAIDSQGNIYLPTYVDNTTNTKLIYDASNITSSLSLNPNYGVHVIKYNTYGQSEWVVSVNTTSSSWNDPFVCVDKQDNLYLLCYNLTNSSIYDKNNVLSSLDVSSLPTSLIIVKYDSSGIATSYVTYGDGDSYVNNLFIDPQDNIVLVGGYSTFNAVYNTNNELSDVYLRQPDAGFASYILKYGPTPSKEQYFLISSNSESLYKHLLNTSTDPVTVKIQNSNNTITLDEFTIYPSQVKSLVYYDSNWHVTNAGISYVSSNSSLDQIFISNSNVGINNSNPQYTLDVNGDINFTGDLIQNGSPYIGSQWTTLSSNVYIIDSNIGIGLSNPTSALTVAGDVEFRSNIFLKNNTFVFRGLKVLKPSSNASLTNVTTTVDSVAGYNFQNNIITLTGEESRFIINTSNLLTLSNQQVGIRNSSPVYDLDVTGDINATGLIRQNGTPIISTQWSNSSAGAVFVMDSNVGIGISNPSYRLHVSGDIYATANVLAYSDSNYKDNIQVIPNALDKVDNITGYTFSFKEDPTSKRYAGLLAQEVQMVLPEVVSRDSNQQLSLAYGNTVALLVNAIKELRAEVKSLKENMSK